MKKCSKCHQEKTLKEFYKDKARTDGHRQRCKVCAKRYQQQRRQEIERENANRQEPIEPLICSLCRQVKERRHFTAVPSAKTMRHHRCKECVAKEARGRRASNPQIVKAKAKEYRDRNEGKIKQRREGMKKKERDTPKTIECLNCKIEKHNEYFYNCAENKTGKRTWCKECHNERTKRDKQNRGEDYLKWKRLYRRGREKEVCYRLSSRVSSAVYNAIKRHTAYGSKGGSTFEYLPYSVGELKEHIEGMFEEWMTWDNWGEWHIDHIIPQAALPYDSLEHPNFCKCWALENLKPISAQKNMTKGSLFEGERHNYKRTNRKATNGLGQKEQISQQH